MERPATESRRVPLFHVESPIRKIGGWGRFQAYENMKASEAWHRFGTDNGTRDLVDLVQRVSKYATKNSDSFVPQSDPEIGNILLSDYVFLVDESFFDPAKVGTVFHLNTVKHQYYEGDQITGWPARLPPRAPFVLVDPSEMLRKRKSANAKDRSGQSNFRLEVLAAYGYRCAVTGEPCVDVLEASHISRL